MNRLPLLALPALALAACGADGNGTAISINATDGDGNASIRTDGDGRVQVRAPGFEGSITLPKIELKADSLDLGGAKLFPGSTVESVNVDATDRGAGGGEGKVRLAFTAPAPLAQVRQWFRDQFAANGIQAELNGDRLEGRMRDGDAVRVAFAPGEGSATRGTIEIR